MCSKSLSLIYGLAFVSFAFALPQLPNVENIVSKPVEAARNSIRQAQAVGKKVASAVSEQASSIPVNLASVNAIQSLSSTQIENAADINKMIDEIEKATEDIFQVELKNIQSWNQDKVLAPFQKQAEEGLTIARNRLKETAEEVRQQVTEALESAKTNLSSEEYSQYIKELQQVIEVELAPVRQYFMDAAEAITQVSNEVATKAVSNPARAANKQTRSSRMQKNTASQLSDTPKM